MILFHRTSSDIAQTILAQGFRDGEGTYLTLEHWSGVWLSNVPLDENEGAEGNTLLEIDLGISNEELAKFDWVEDGKPYREFLIPADVVNVHSIVRISNVDERPSWAP